MGSSPRTWGCFLLPAKSGSQCHVFPTHVGVFRHWDGPSPEVEVFPTHVGVFPVKSEPVVGGVCLPHARGGVSHLALVPRGRDGSSPRTWGCFLTTSPPCTCTIVFPTHVGVFLMKKEVTIALRGLPHARGGVSPSSRSLSTTPAVFPTHVGVFPRLPRLTVAINRLPHARGGVSLTPGSSLMPGRSSPRTWGCFYKIIMGQSDLRVFPTHVGVFPRPSRTPWPTGSLPHARGGVSMRGGYYPLKFESSPRTWGCFQRGAGSPRSRTVFPTHVGVFPHQSRILSAHEGLPHARGGVSFERVYVAFSGGSSPRTWGCFYYEVHGVVIWRVFPTHVGVFLFNMPLADMETRLPHARGGVSGVERGHSL